MPMKMSNRPDASARVAAAARYSGVPVPANFPIAAAVISEITATGPTANVRLVPKTQ